MQNCSLIKRVDLQNLGLFDDYKMPRLYRNEISIKIFCVFRKNRWSLQYDLLHFWGLFPSRLNCRLLRNSILLDVTWSLLRRTSSLGLQRPVTSEERNTLKQFVNFSVTFLFKVWFIELPESSVSRVDDVAVDVEVHYLRWSWRRCKVQSVVDRIAAEQSSVCCVVLVKVNKVACHWTCDSVRCDVPLCLTPPGSITSHPIYTRHAASTSIYSCSELASVHAWLGSFIQTFFLYLIFLWGLCRFFTLILFAIWSEKYLDIHCSLFQFYFPLKH